MECKRISATVYSKKKGGVTPIDNENVNKSRIWMKQPLVKPLRLEEMAHLSIMSGVYLSFVHSVHTELLMQQLKQAPEAKEYNVFRDQSSIVTS